MQLHNLRSPKGAKNARKRVGRGDGSGHGSYSGRGIKGQKARSGGRNPNFEGGQIPLHMSLPALRGFTNIFRKEYSVVNIRHLAQFPANSQVTPQVMAKAGVIKEVDKPVKVLGDGELDRPLIVEAHRFSKSARQKIEAAGGSIKEVK